MPASEWNKAAEFVPGQFGEFERRAAFQPAMQIAR
jgi:hypothetical protein